MNDAQKEVLKKAAQDAATRALIAALVESHPNPDALRAAIAKFSSWEMLTLTTNADPGDLRDFLMGSFVSALNVMIALVPKQS